MDADEVSLIRSDRAVELHAVPSVHLYLSFVIYPRHPEFKLSFRLYQSLEKGFSSELLFICFYYNSERFQHFLYRLMKFRSAGFFLTTNSMTSSTYDIFITSSDINQPHRKTPARPHCLVYFDIIMLCSVKVKQFFTLTFLFVIYLKYATPDSKIFRSCSP